MFTSHPVVKLWLAILYVGLIFFIPLAFKAVLVFTGALIASQATQATRHDPARIFLRMWLIATFFLVLIHLLSFSSDSSINISGIYSAGEYSLRIAAFMTACLWLIRSTSSDEWFSFLISCHAPLHFIYVLFLSLFLLPRIADRLREILIAQQARGFRVKGVLNRFKAYTMVLSPLFATMINEMEENSVAIIARGLTAPGLKTSACRIRMKLSDISVLSTSTMLFALLLYLALKYAHCK